MKRADAIRPGILARHLEKKAEVGALVAAGERIHPDILKMRSLLAEKAENVLTATAEAWVPEKGSEASSGP